MTPKLPSWPATLQALALVPSPRLKLRHMGFKTNNPLVDVRLSKTKATIKNIASLTAVGNLAVNQLMEHKATAVVTTKVAFAKEPN